MVLWRASKMSTSTSPSNMKTCTNVTNKVVVRALQCINDKVELHTKKPLAAN